MRRCPATPRSRRRRCVATRCSTIRRRAIARSATSTCRAPAGGRRSSPITRYAALGVPRNPEIPGQPRSRAISTSGCAGPYRKDLARETAYCGMFKTPTLRNAASRQVFFHNGRFHTLDDVLHFYVERDTDPRKWYPIVAGKLDRIRRPAARISRQRRPHRCAHGSLRRREAGAGRSRDPRPDRLSENAGRWLFGPLPVGLRIDQTVGRIQAKRGRSRCDGALRAQVVE